MLEACVGQWALCTSPHCTCGRYYPNGQQQIGMFTPLASSCATCNLLQSTAMDFRPLRPQTYLVPPCRPDPLAVLAPMLPLLLDSTTQEDSLDHVGAAGGRGPHMMRCLTRLGCQWSPYAFGDAVRGGDVALVERLTAGGCPMPVRERGKRFGARAAC